MPITIDYNNPSTGLTDTCTIRPTPLVNISTNILKNGAGEAYGVTYSITLTGSFLPNEGTPYAIDHKGLEDDEGDLQYGRFPFFESEFRGGVAPTDKGPYNAFDGNSDHRLNAHPPRQRVPINQYATAIFSKQRALRALFAQDGQQVCITDIDENKEAVIFYPRVVTIDMPEGPFVTKADYSITLEADVLYHPATDGFQMDLDSTMVPHMSGGSPVTVGIPLVTTNQDLIESMSGAFIQNYSEDWAIEVDDGQAESLDLARSYRITHNMSATGKTHYMRPNGAEEVQKATKIPAWHSARSFVTNRLKDDGTNGYPNVLGRLGSGTMDLIAAYGGFNCVRSENVNEFEGTFSVNESWFISSGTAYETFQLDVSTSNSDPFVNVSINGNVKGLTSIAPSGSRYGGTGESPPSGLSPYDNAIKKYNSVTNDGLFGISSDIYKRANNSVAVQLNSQPTSTSLGVNERLGEINYSLQFNNRPTNIISGVLSESITVNDTYPGDIFAIIPVIGRKTGPILQYLGGRTEYRRDISLDLLMDYTDIPYGTGRSLILKKPSVVEPTATQIADLLNSVSPQGEPGVRKCFISPPTENWNPKQGSYSFSISFTYELDK